MRKNKKIMHYTEGYNVRELVQKANELDIPREDIVGIVLQKDYYYLVYYYGDRKD